MSANDKRRGGVLLPPERAEALQRVLTALRRDTIAQCVLLADEDGRLVAEAGSARETLLDGVLPILAEEISVVARLGQKWNKGAVLSLHHYEGGQYEIYAASAADTPFVLVAVTWQRPPAYSGVIWLFVRRTMQELRWILRDDDGLAAEAVSVGGLTAAQAQALGLLAERAVKETVRSDEA